MSVVLRRFNDPTRWAGIPIKVWVAGGTMVGATVGFIILTKPPLLIGFAVATYVVLLPVGLLALWSFATGVPILIIVGDFLRFALRRQAEIEHERQTHLVGGVYVVDRPQFDALESAGYSSDVDGALFPDQQKATS